MELLNSSVRYTEVHVAQSKVPLILPVIKAYDHLIHTYVLYEAHACFCYSTPCIHNRHRNRQLEPHPDRLFSPLHTSSLLEMQRPLGDHCTDYLVYVNERSL